MDLFPEIDRRMEIFDMYEAWYSRRPWRWLPTWIAPRIFRRWFAEREVRKRYG